MSRTKLRYRKSTTRLSLTRTGAKYGPGPSYRVRIWTQRTAPTGRVRATGRQCDLAGCAWLTILPQQTRVCPMDHCAPPKASGTRRHDRCGQQDGQNRLGGDEPWRSIPPGGIRHRLTEDKSIAEAGYRIGESDCEVMAIGRDRGLEEPVSVHAHQARHSGWYLIRGLC